MRSIIIRKLDPANKKSLDSEYQRFITMCDEYKDLPKETFFKCNNSIHIIEDRMITEYIGNFYGIIGARTVTMQEAKIDKLDFYCKPYNTDHSVDLIYCIEFFHISSFSRNINEYEQIQLINELLKYCLADKNDGFTVYKIKCENIDKYSDILKNNNFNFYGTEYMADGEKQIPVYVRAPEMGTRLD